MQAGKFGFYGDNCTVRINSLNAKLIYRTQDPQNQIRQETDDFISTAFSFIGGDMTIVGTAQQLNGYQTTHCTGALAFSSATPNVNVSIRDYSGGGRGNFADVKMWAGCRPYLINSKTGTELNVGPHITGNNSSVGICRVYQEFSLNIKEFGGGNISDAKLYFQDYDNRRLYNQENPAIDLQPTFTYTGTSDVNGNIASQEILIGSVIADLSYGASSSAINTGLYAWDYRSKNNNTDDLFDMNMVSYNHSILSLSDIELKGTGGTQLNTVMFVDDLITETTKTTVDGYTELETPQKFYDRAKSFLFDNYAGESETILSRDGNIISTGTNNVTIDATAGNAFAFDGATIIIKTNTYTGDIITTGTVTLANSALLQGGFKDATGINKLIDLEWTPANMQNITIINHDDNSVILAPTAATGNFRTLLNFPTPANVPDSIEVKIQAADGSILYSQLVPSEQLSLIDKTIVLADAATLNNQLEILQLTERILSKSEAIKNALNNTGNTTLNVNETLSADVASPSLTNQETILKLLKQVLLKTTVSREVLKE
ncbi:MAG: hypothetical protein ACPGTG_02785 [Flavobacteriales bacterium]